MADVSRLAVRICDDGEDVFATTPAITKTAATLSMDSADNSINDSGNGFVTAGFKPFMEISVTGFTGDTSNNKKYIIQTVAAGKMVLTNGTVVTDGAGETVTVKAPAMRTLRLTSESLKQSTNVTPSNEIRDDRQRADVIRASISAMGDIGYELSYGAFDMLMAAALQADFWSDEVSETAITFSMDNADNSVNDSGSGFVTAGYEAYQWIKISGFTEAANNGWFKIVSVAAGKMVLSGGTVATEIAGDSVTIQQGAYIENGTTMHSFTIEKEFKDLTNQFATYLGMHVNQWTMNIPAEQIITGSFSFMGKLEESGVATVSLADIDAPTNPIMNTIDNVPYIVENLSEIEITELSFTINNNLRGRSVVGELGPESLGAGTIDLSGTLKIYFEDATLFAKYLAYTSTSIAFVLEDADDNAYLIEFPEVKLTDGQRVAGGANSDILAEFNFSAYRDSTEVVTMRVARF